MDSLIMSGIAFVCGGLLVKLLSKSGPGPFEQTLWTGLHQGKRVVVSIDEDAFIFELHGNNLRITRGTSQFTENPYAGILTDETNTGDKDNA